MSSFPFLLELSAAITIALPFSLAAVVLRGENVLLYAGTSQARWTRWPMRISCLPKWLSRYAGNVLAA